MSTLRNLLQQIPPTYDQPREPVNLHGIYAYRDVFSRCGTLDSDAEKQILAIGTKTEVVLVRLKSGAYEVCVRERQSYVSSTQT